jgi:hypothetical protein
MKTTLIRINSSEAGMYYVGFGLGFELERHHGWFAGLIIQFLPWTIRIGIDREVE